MSSSNEMTVSFKSIPSNERFARVVISAFVASLNPTLEELADIKTAVSEAVTNSIIHGYDSNDGLVIIKGYLNNNEITIEIIDKGHGIENIQQAMEPLFTTKPELERSGMGFSFMEAFMDSLEVKSKTGEGTTVTMRKVIGASSDNR